MDCKRIEIVKGYWDYDIDGEEEEEYEEKVGYKWRCVDEKEEED